MLAGAGPDVLALETVPDIDEAEALMAAISGLGVPAWLSYSVAGERTRAGQSLSEAFAVASGVPEVVAVPLFRRAVDGGGGENRGRVLPSPAR